MPFSAIDKATGSRVYSFDFETKRQLIDKYLKGSLRCACEDCNADVFPRESKRTKLHFVHTTVCNTKMGYHPESLEHLEGKRSVREFLLSNREDYSGAEIGLEYPIPEAGKHGRIADIAVAYPSGWLEIHEIQLASITTEELEARTNDYRDVGADVFWWLGKSANTETNRDWCVHKTGRVYQLLFNDVSCEDALVFI